MHCELISPRGVASVQFPSCITSLELEVPRKLHIHAFPFGEILEDEGAGEMRRFNAFCLTALTALKDLALTGWHKHDLFDLSSTVTSIRILNPKSDDFGTSHNTPEVIGASVLRFPLNLMSEKAKAAVLAQRALRKFENTHSSAAKAELRREAQDAPDWRSDMEEDGDSGEEIEMVENSAGGVDGGGINALAPAAPVNINASIAADGDNIGQEGIVDLIVQDFVDLGNIPGADQPINAALNTSQRRRRRHRRRSNPHNDNGLDEGAAFASMFAGHDDDMYIDGLEILDDIGAELLYQDLIDFQVESHLGGGRGGGGGEGNVPEPAGVTVTPQHEAQHAQQAQQAQNQTQAQIHRDSPGQNDKCNDPNCIIHSGKHHLQLNFSDDRQDIVINLRYLIESKIPMISITLDPTMEASAHGVYAFLEFGESWEAFIEALRGSSVDVLEINHHLNGVIFTPNFVENVNFFYLSQGMKLLEESLRDDFEFRTWDGTLSRKGLVESGMCYALVRKKKEGIVL